jgi:hypothetical protein
MKQVALAIVGALAGGILAGNAGLFKSGVNVVRRLWARIGMAIIVGFVLLAGLQLMQPRPEISKSCNAKGDSGDCAVNDKGGKGADVDVNVVLVCHDRERLAHVSARSDGRARVTKLMMDLSQVSGYFPNAQVSITGICWFVHRDRLTDQRYGIDKKLLGFLRLLLIGLGQGDDVGAHHAKARRELANAHLLMAKFGFHALEPQDLGNPPGNFCAGVHSVLDGALVTTEELGQARD